MHHDFATTPTQRLPVFSGRYGATDVLKRGGSVTTYRAVDLDTGERVVVKAAPRASLPEGAELLLRHEVAVLQAIDHPAVLPLLDSGADGDHLYFVMPLVDGVTLAERIGRGPLPVLEALTVAEQLLDALGAVFDQGVLHRDVKPANIIVNPDAPLRRITLIDFGFSRSDQLDPGLRDLPIGTARYVSPEQAGLIGHDVDARSDLYSAGVVIFEALAGRPPYVGDTVGEVLRAHVSAPVPRLRELGIDAPRALDELVSRLLAKDPRNRYQTAAAAIADVRAIADGLAAGESEPKVVIGAHDRRCCVLGEPAFVGRAHQLDQLVGACTDQKPGGDVVAVEAESGGGKTRLLEELSHRVVETGMWVLQGQAVDQSAQRPFLTLQGVVSAIVSQASADPEFSRQVRDGVGEHAAAACAAIPALAEILDPDPAEALGPEAFGAERSIAALSSLLDAIGTPDRPAAVVLDDCQWADPLTVRLLKEWSNRSPVTAHTTVVVAYRSEEVGPGDALREVRSDLHLTLPPLDDDDVSGLVESMAGDVGADAVAVVVDLAEGSPFMASAVLHGLVEAGALVCAHPGWTIDRDALDGAQSSSRAATFLAERLDLLPPSTRLLLSAGAAIGKEFDLELAAHLAGQSTGDAVRARQEARARHLIWAPASGARCTFVHDKIREALLDGLDPTRRRDFHRAAAERIEQDDPSRVFELAYHFDAGGEHRRALPYALEAATQARSQQALEVAQQQYLIAGRALEGEGRQTRFDVAEGMGDVAMLLGEYTEARDHYRAAYELAGSRFTQSEIEAKLSELAFKHGDLDESADAAERGLRLLGHRVPKRKAGFLVAAVREIFVQALHTLLPRLFVHRRELSKGRSDLLAARHYSRLAHVYWFTIGPVPTLWTHLREMNLAERYEPTRELAQAYSEHAPVMTLLPWLSRGMAYAERSLEIRRDLNDVWGQGQSLNFYGIVLFTGARYEQTMEACREAVRLLRRTGDQWELNIAKLHLAYALFRVGRLGEAAAIGRETHADGVRIGDLQAAGIGLEIAALADDGNVEEAAVSVELGRHTPDVQLKVQVMQAEGMRRLAADDVTGAIEILSDAVRRARKAQVRNEYVAPARALLASARRRHAEEVSPFATDRRQRVREARRAARRARWIAHTYRNNAAHALRESGLAAALAGRDRAARRLLHRAVERAVDLGQRHEQALSLQALGQVGSARGWPGAAECLEEGARLENELRAAFERRSDLGTRADGVTLSLVERFSTLLDQGRAIARGLSRDLVFQTVEKAAVKLLRAEQCFVLDVADGHLDGDPTDLSSSLVHGAVAAGHPIIADQDDPDASSEHLVLSGVRSALCAPIFEHGSVTACFYATHRSMSGLFGDDEIRLAEFVATVAGAALENARGFAEVEALKDSLEERVEERTNQLQTTLHELERLNDELREANETKSEFVSMVSHELRTPLTPIVGLSSTMLQRWKDMDDAVIDECLEAIHRQGVRLTRLVDDLLEISRIEAGTLEAHPRQVSVADVVDATVEEMGSRLGEISVHCPEGTTALADPDRLHQILVNYLENARKYGAAPYEVVVEAKGPWVEMAVVDHGDGVPDEFVGSLFEKFARAAATNDATGTGLGLSIVRGLAMAQGGDAWHEPLEPHGSRFLVRLPRPPQEMIRRETADATV